MAITIIPHPEHTVAYKLGWHDGNKGKRAIPAQGWEEFYRNAYMMGYADGYKGVVLPKRREVRACR